MKTGQGFLFQNDQGHPTALQPGDSICIHFDSGTISFGRNGDRLYLRTKGAPRDEKYPLMGIRMLGHKRRMNLADKNSALLVADAYALVFGLSAKLEREFTDCLLFRLT